MPKYPWNHADVCRTYLEAAVREGRLMRRGLLVEDLSDEEVIALAREIAMQAFLPRPKDQTH